MINRKQRRRLRALEEIEQRLIKRGDEERPRPPCGHSKQEALDRCWSYAEMTTLPETAPQPRKSSADYANWRETVPRMEQGDDRLLGHDAQAQPGRARDWRGNAVCVRPQPGPRPPRRTPRQGAPCRAVRRATVHPARHPATPHSLPAGDDSNFTPQMQTDLLGALQSLTGKPGFEQLGPLLGLTRQRIRPTAPGNSWPIPLSRSCWSNSNSAPSMSL